MADATQLMVRLEAKLDNFEKQMKQAGVLADSAVKDIEDRFSKANPQLGNTWATAVGTGLGNFASGAISQALDLLHKFNDQLRSIDATARVTGLSLVQVFGNEKVLGEGAGRGLERVATLLDRFHRGETDNALGSLFDANKIDTSKITSVAEAWDRAVNIIARAPNIVQAREIGASLGISDETVDRIRQVGNEFQTLRDKAIASAPDLDRLAQMSKEFDAAWKLAIEAVKGYLVSNLGEMASTIASFLASTVQELRAVASIGQGVRSLFGMSTEGGKLSAAAETLEGIQKRLAAFAEAAEKRAAGNRPPPGGPSTPAPIARSRGGGESEALSPFEREERRAEETTQRLQLETSLVGQNTETRTRALEVLRLEQMLRREGITDLDTYRDRIEKWADGFAKADAALEKARESLQEFRQVQNFAGTQLVSFFSDMASGSVTVEQSLRRIVQAMTQAALQAAILGSGPLAGLFGTRGDNGATGGLIGLATNGLFGRAEGGSVEAGGTYLVGERGPELLRMRAPGTVVPNDVVRAAANGSMTLTHSPVFNIDARGAQVGVAEQIAAGLRAYDANIRRNIGSMIQGSRLRYA